MGLFSKIKNYVTGGGAELSVEIESPSLIEAFTVRVNAHIQSDDLAVESVYVKLRGLETVECRVNVTVRVDGKSVSSWENIHETKTTHEQTLTLAGPGTLEAGMSYQWAATVSLPANAQPAYKGPNARHEWQLLAGLDVPGNDPDSDWVSISFK